jgi:hypothetical protein
MKTKMFFAVLVEMLLLLACRVDPEPVEAFIAAERTAEAPARVHRASLTRRSGRPAVSLKSRDALASLDRHDFGAVDYFQNESITVSAEIAEPETVQEAFLHLHDESGRFIAALSPANCSAANPEWVISGDYLRNLGLGFDEGRHLIRAEIFTIGTGNARSESLGWFIWDADSDKPRIAVDETGLGIHVFDDDGLGCVYGALFTRAEIEAIAPGITAGKRLEALARDGALRTHTIMRMGSPAYSAGSEQVRDYAFTVKAEQGGSFFLLVLAQDRKASGQVWAAALREVQVPEEA